MKTIEELAHEAGARELVDMGRPSAKRDLAFNAKQLARFAYLIRKQALAKKRRSASLSLSLLETARLKAEQWKEKK